MTRNIGANAAGRVFNIFNRFRGARSKGGRASALWLEVLGISPTGSEARDSIIVARHLDVLMRELDVISKTYAAMELPADLLEQYQLNIHNALQIDLLPHSKENTVQYLTEVVLLSLRWWSIVMPDDDIAVVGEDMAALSGHIDALEQALAKDGIPAGLRAYAERLLEELRAAIVMTAIEGVKPLREAVRKAVSDAHFEEDSIKAELAGAEERPEV
ncbi:hypothetical protein C380_18125 [Acidovorax sp. KKS102]|uniref:hypothetical protein n=1 Tax=Acidovorax sp. KKS102 TaxID=358220 RepID=UPI00028A9245|nr:hypothetical protein [Acidovorax sp. KKS102]AFU47319.1 hypothetical protein C380_18125 [Acidovorax sp. KKS102]